MKKQLLCTSAIALGVTAAAPASAQSWDLDWGGYMNQHVAWSDSSGSGTPVVSDYDGVDTLNNSEIHFTPSVTLDNGLTFGVNIQLEGNNSRNGAGEGDNYIDESYMTISSDQIGKIVIGDENSAGYLSMVGAPQVTSMYINSPSISAFLPFTAAGVGISFRDAMHSSYTEVAGNNDVNRITYYTPNFSGFTAGISYAATGSVNASNNYSVDRNGVNEVSDIFDIGLNYSGTIGSVDLNLGARWGTGSVNSFNNSRPVVINGTTTFYSVGDPSTWGVGGTIGFSGFTIGGHYAENDNGGFSGFNGIGGRSDSSGWSFGATYDAPGPWAFEALTFQGKSDSDPTLVGGDNKYEAYQIGANRDVGPGVSWSIYGVWAKEDNKDTIGTDLDDGYIIGTAINLSF